MGVPSADPRVDPSVGLRVDLRVGQNRVKMEAGERAPMAAVRMAPPRVETGPSSVVHPWVTGVWEAHAWAADREPCLR